MNFKKMRASCNPNPGFGERTRGGSRRIVGRKVVWFQTAFGHAHNCVFVRGHRPRSHPRRGQEKGANANSEPLLKREG
jgi:hypothetical protein